MPDKVDKAILGTSTVSGVIAGTCGTLKMIGFKGAGIAAKSLAAGIQAGIGNVATGSAFSIIQSFGASGVLTTGLISGGIVVGVGLTYWGLKTYTNWKSKL